MTNRHHRISAAALAAAALVLAGCWAAARRTPPGRGAPPGLAGAGAAPAAGPQRPGGRFGSAIPVQAVAVQVGPLKTGNDTTGTIVAVTQSTVASQVAGVVSCVVHQAGDWVKAGTTVVLLDDSQLKLAVQTAQSNLENAKINYEVGLDNANQSDPKLALPGPVRPVRRGQRPEGIRFAERIVRDRRRPGLGGGQRELPAPAGTGQPPGGPDGPGPEQEVRHAVHRPAEAGHRPGAERGCRSRSSTSRTPSIKAPFAGQIAAVNMNPGMYVSLNTAVFVLVSAERQVDFNVSPADAPPWRPGHRYNFTYQGKNYAGAHQPGALGPHQRRGAHGGRAARARRRSPTAAVGTVSYTLTLAQGALVPIAALQTNEDQNYVFAVENGKVVVEAHHDPGGDGHPAAATGVTAGTQVIVNPPPGLLEGSAVQVVSLTARPRRRGSGGTRQTGSRTCHDGRAPTGGAPAAGVPGPDRRRRTGRHDRSPEDRMKTLRSYEAKIFDKINPPVSFSVRRYVLAIGIFVAIVVVRRRLHPRPRRRPAARDQHPGRGRVARPTRAPLRASWTSR